MPLNNKYNFELEINDSVDELMESALETAIDEENDNLIRAVPKINTDECIGCGSCVGTCPTGALSLSDMSYAECDFDVCIGCFACVDACPLNIIEQSQQLV